MKEIWHSLSKQQQKTLLHDLNYLNLTELTKLCKHYDLPIANYYVNERGRLQKTATQARKRIVIERIKQYLMTGKIAEPTVYVAEVVRFESLPAVLKSTTKLHYGQYDKRNQALTSKLGQLTQTQFKDGAVAREVLNDFWSRGIAPTLEQFAKAWVHANHDCIEHPEWAFLADRKQGMADADWKALRTQKAKQVLKLLQLAT